MRIAVYQAAVIPPSGDMPQRLETTPELLAQSALPLVEIARPTGFAGAAHLSHCCAREYGALPSHRRRPTKTAHEHAKSHSLWSLGRVSLASQRKGLRGRPRIDPVGRQKNPQFAQH